MDTTWAGAMVMNWYHLIGLAHWYEFINFFFLLLWSHNYDYNYIILCLQTMDCYIRLLNITYYTFSRCVLPLWFFVSIVYVFIFFTDCCNFFTFELAWGLWDPSLCFRVVCLGSNRWRVSLRLTRHICLTFILL